MAAIQPGYWGIDLGQCALKAIRIEVVEGQVTATAFDYVEHPKILSQPDADPDQLTREALETFLSRNNLKGDTVVISVPGQSGLARFVKLPPVEEKKIADIVKFEAKQQIPFNLDEVVWDYQKIGAGMVTDGFAMDTEIGLFAIKRDMVNRALAHFQEVSVDVHIVQMAPLALCNFVSYDLLAKDGEADEETRGKKQCVVALDLGTDTSGLVITDGQRIIWQRPIPLGGNHFTRALTKDLKLTFAKAEHLKRNATKSGAAELKKILAALKPVLNDFVAEVQRSLGYFSNTHRDAEIKYLIGLGNAFRLPGLQKFLGEKLQLEVRKLGKMERLAGEVITQPLYADNVLGFAVAYGLALQGAGLGRIQTNLLPNEIRIERLVKAKKPYAVTAAAALLFGAAAVALGYAMDYRAVGADVVTQAINDSKNVVSEKSRWDSEYTTQKGKVEEEQKAVKSIIAGQDERFNWVAFHQFLNQCLPRPDDGRTLLSPNAQKLYWTDKAVDAAKKLAKRQSGVKAAPGTDPDDGIDDLVQLNIETVDQRYTTNLAGFWSNLTSLPDYKDGISKRVRPIAHAATPPAENDKGWVVELRGYTYNRGGEPFVLETLVENIARLGVRTQPTAPAAGDGGAAAGGATPAPTDPAAGGDPSATPPAAGAEQPKKNSGPVIDRISHVLLFKADSKTALMGQGVVAALIGGGSASGAPGGGPPGLGGPVAPGGDFSGMPMGGGAGGGWQPLSSAGTGQNMGGGGAFMPPGGGRPPIGGMPMGEGGVGGSSGDTRKPLHTRTEFIVLFIWREPTPSDALMRDGPASDGGAPVGGGGGADPTMMPPI